MNEFPKTVLLTIGKYQREIEALQVAIEENSSVPLKPSVLVKACFEKGLNELMHLNRVQVDAEGDDDIEDGVEIEELDV